MDARDYNSLLMYIHLKCALNHMECLKGLMDKYTENKFKETEKSVMKLIGNTERFLLKNGDTEAIEKLIMKIHDEVENLTKE